MKIGILGFGSAGQRYARILMGMKHLDFEIFVFRRRNRNELISPNLINSKTEDPVTYYGCKQIDSLEEMTKLHLDLVIVASPNSLHFQDSMPFIDQHTPLIIEKPMGIHVNEVMSLLETASRKNTFISVPFISRVHPIFGEIKKFLERIELNEIISAKSWFLESVSQMHPYEDPSESYINSAFYGGGAVRALCHEFDLWNALVGNLRLSVTSNSKSYRNFSGEVDTQVKVFCESEKLATVLVEIDLDLITSPKKRGGIIETSSERISWDWVAGLVTVEKDREVVFSSNYNISSDEIWIKYLGEVLAMISKKNSFQKKLVASSMNIAILIDEIERKVPVE